MKMSYMLPLDMVKTTCSMSLKVLSWYVNILGVKLLHTISMWVTQGTIGMVLSRITITKGAYTIPYTIVYHKHDPRKLNSTGFVNSKVVSWYIKILGA